MSIKATHLDVDGMSCSNCVRHVEDALRGLDGVENFEVQIGKVRIDHDPTKLPPERVLEAITEAGYEPRITS